MTDYHDVASLRRDKALLARALVALQHKQYPAFESLEDQEYARALENTTSNLDYLLTSYEEGSKSIFHKYLEWAEDLFHYRGLPAHTLTGSYRAIATYLGQMKSEGTCEAVLADGLLKWIDEGLVHLAKRETGDAALRLNTPHQDILTAYGEALLAADRPKATGVIRRALAEGVPIKALYRYVFHPFQINLGELWHRREITVGQEHLATAATQFIMSLLYDELLATPKKDKSMIGACVGGELHEMGMRMVCDYMEASGWHTYYLGANTPGRGLADLAREKAVDAIALSCTMAYHLPKLKAMIRRLHEELPYIPILVGGYPFIIDSELYRKVGADGSAGEFEAVLRLFETTTAKEGVGWEG